MIRAALVLGLGVSIALRATLAVRAERARRAAGWVE